MMSSYRRTRRFRLRVSRIEGGIECRRCSAALDVCTRRYRRLEGRRLRARDSLPLKLAHVDGVVSARCPGRSI